MWSQGKLAGNGGGQVKIGPVEEHPSMAYASPRPSLYLPLPFGLSPSQEPVDIVVVA